MIAWIAVILMIIYGHVWLALLLALLIIFSD